MHIERPMITLRQFVMLVFIGGIVIKGLMLPSVLLRISGKDGLFVMLFYFVIEIINVWILSYLIGKYPDKTFFAMMEECFGKVLSRIIAMTIVVAALVKLTLNLSEVKAFFAIGMFSSLNWGIMVIPLLALCFVIAVKSLRILGRTVEIFFPFITVCIVLLIVIVFREVPLENVLPLLEDGFEPIKRGILEFPIWFGDIIVMSVAMGNVKKSKRLVLLSVIARLLSCMLILAFSVALYSTYGNIIPLVKYGHNITSLTQYNLGSQEYGRFDLIIYAVWMSGVFIKMAMNCYLGVRCASFVIGVKNYKYVAAALAVAAYVMSVFVTPTIINVYMLSTATWAKIAFALIEYCLPALLLIGATVKYGKNGTPEKSEKCGNTEVKENACEHGQEQTQE